MSHRLTLGRVAGVYGVKGWVKLQSFTRPADNLLEYRDVWIVDGNDATDGFEAKLTEGRIHGGTLVARLTGPDRQVIEDRDVAAAMIGREIQVDRSRLPKPDEGEFYWFDLVGLAVRNEEGVMLGKVESLTSNGAQDVLVVQDGETERLIPFVQGPIIRSVNLETNEIVADWQPDY
ncbi:MAG: rimM [Panacagrimonas sp.]|jgi:16S rRNA processing protein RimM|nr:ribosome maturation factor RimM [Panacagrimonas sp.]MCC2657780.1 rimM [Panacagrimonas sp.]